jgi:uncharacterized protein with HEPN domain
LSEAVAKIIRFTRDMDHADFLNDELVRDAVLRNLEVIGEAAKHIPKEARDSVPDIDWRRIIGFRSVIAHAYFGIDDVILVDIVFVKLPLLRQAISKVKDM